jgi:predicted glutamine amidotransferase
VIDICQIHFIKPIGRKIQQADLRQLSKMLELGSQANKDGFGVFNNVKLYKGERYSQSRESAVLSLFEGSTFAVAHNRLGTNGLVKKANAHPFSNSRFVWCHNGQIFNDDELTGKYKLTGITVDSKVIGEVLLIKSKQKDVLQAIKETLEELEGTYSVFIFDKQQKRLFYARHDEEFEFRLLTKGDDCVTAGSTDADNLERIYANSGKRKHGFNLSDYVAVGRLVPKDGYVYEISDGLEKVVKFEPKKYTTAYAHGTIRDLELLLSECYDDLVRVEKMDGNTVRIHCKDKQTEQRIRQELRSTVKDDMTADYFELMDVFYEDCWYTPSYRWSYCSY